MENRELIAAATRGEWTLEHDRKMLDIMQNIASKIEKRAVNTKANVNTMLLSLDECAIRFSNLTRITDVKNTVYCENLITDDHHLQSSNESEKTSKFTVNQSTEAAIQNGLKLVENCFERHKVKLDPRNSRSEETIVYRSIDNFYSPLPFLIGSEKWREKWHLGLIESTSTDKQSYAESIDSSATPMKPELEKISVASVDSLARSSSSIGEQMVINNKQGGLFDEPEPPQQPSSSSSSYFPQPAARNIINFFNEEPPELPSIEPSPSQVKRKPTNLFDDIDSVESMPIHDESETHQISIPHHPPVDLFNDNEFDSFIKKIETTKTVKTNIEKPEVVKVEEKKKQEINVQRDMKNIAEELNRKIQMKNTESNTNKSKSVVDIVEEVGDTKTPKKTENLITPKIEQARKFEINKTPEAQKVETPKFPEMKKVEIKPTPKRITNLFDDEDDSEDFFAVIIKQKSETKKVEEQIPKSVEKSTKKISNLFDDDDDDQFDEIFKKKTSPPIVKAPVETKNLTERKELLDDASKVKSKLFDENLTRPKVSMKLFDDDDIQSDETVQPTKLVNEDKVSKKLFVDDPPEIKEEIKISENLFEKVPKILKDTSKMNLFDDKIVNVTPKISIEDKNLIESSKTLSLLKTNSENSTQQEKKLLDESDDLLNSNKSFHTQVGHEASEESDSSAILTDEKDKQVLEKLQTKSNIFENIESEIVDNAIKTDDNKSEEIMDVPKDDLKLKSEFSMPLFDDEPPPDDDNWVDDDNNHFDESENRINDRNTFSPNTSTFSMPLFDEIPPEDEDYRNPPPLPEFDEEIEDDIKEDNLELPETFDEIKINSSDMSITDIPSKINEDEVDKSSVSIKSKLDMFSRSLESKAIPKQAPEPKKLPGKLNMNLNINVNALMPGAKIPTKKIEEEEEVLPVGDTSQSTPPSSKIVTSEPSSTGLLNNDFAKSRAKISVKRRPSTRQGRRMNYEKTIQSQVEEDNNKEDLITEKEDKLEIVATPKNLAPSLFANELDDDDDDDFLSPPIHQQKQKVSIFYDDEAETKKQLEIQKAKVKKVDNLSNDVTSSHAVVESEPKISVKKENISLFGDDIDDDDLFGGSSTVIKAKKMEIPKKPLFDDDDNDDLFGASMKKTVEKKKPPPPKNSLFGDESSDDDDLFSSKPKKSDSQKATMTATKKSTSEKKNVSRVSDDPLKDLLGN